MVSRDRQRRQPVASENAKDFQREVSGVIRPEPDKIILILKTLMLRANLCVILVTIDSSGGSKIAEARLVWYGLATHSRIGLAQYLETLSDVAAIGSGKPAHHAHNRV
jgi:hypothetical protein